MGKARKYRGITNRVSMIFGKPENDSPKIILTFDKNCDIIYIEKVRMEERISEH